MSLAPCPFGSHVLADFHGVDARRLSNRGALESLLRAAAHAAGAKVLGSHFHSFGSGAGVTGVVLLAESHLSIHTWPEEGFAAADIFMCGRADPERALAVLLDALAPAHHHVDIAVRGTRRLVTGAAGEIAHPGS